MSFINLTEIYQNPLYEIKDITESIKAYMNITHLKKMLIIKKTLWKSHC